MGGKPSILWLIAVLLTVYSHFIPVHAEEILEDLIPIEVNCPSQAESGEEFCCDISIINSDQKNYYDLTLDMTFPEYVLYRAKRGFPMGCHLGIENFVIKNIECPLRNLQSGQSQELEVCFMQHDEGMLRAQFNVFSLHSYSELEETHEWVRIKIIRPEE